MKKFFENIFMISITIDDFEILTRPNISILEACKHAGVNIPRFCYHETLSVAGNCRMCLVEIENNEKPVASCVTEIEDGMTILTNSAFVKKARENVVEALLLSHPLDCPICDQAGECDLQDQTKTFGSAQSRYFFKKNTAEDKYCGPLIKTIMTRCISCTRCVRYSTEIAGEDFFGTLNRGGNTEIGSYTPKFFKSEISGNVIDLCPVGALTSQPYAFKARPWELRVSETIDFTDSLGSNVYVNYKETEIARVLPKINKKINENIISDKARFSYDANHTNRIKDLFICDKDSKFRKTNWEKVLPNLETLFNDKISFAINSKTDLDTLYYLKHLTYLYPEKFRICDTNSTNKKRNLYLTTQTNLTENINNIADAVIFLSTNPKVENAVLNSKIRFKVKNEMIDIYSFGINYNYNYSLNFMHFNIRNLINSLEGKVINFNKILFQCNNPLFVVGEAFLHRISDVHIFKTIINKIFPKNFTIVLFHNLNESSTYLASISNLNSNISESKKLIFSLSDENVSLRKFVKNLANKLVLHDTHGNNLALSSEIVLPAPTLYENKQICLNLEDRPQKTEKIFYDKKNTKNLRNILRSLIKVQNYKGNFNVFNHEMTKVVENYDHLNSVNKKLKQTFYNFTAQNLAIIKNYPLSLKLKNFYYSDTYTKNSLTLNICSNEIIKNHKNI
jgi:NADH-quinone oxidoreductase chain G